jgi:glycosyltransferase involved in cell wall biosynthesis
LGAERSLEVWSLAESERPAGLDPDVVFRCASGRRVGFASLALRTAASLRATLVLVTHVHLLPVVLPLQWRGAMVVPILMGIEAWKPLRPLEVRALRRAWRVLSISSHTIGRFTAANPSLAYLAVDVCHPGVAAAAEPRRDRVDGRYALIVARMSREERYKGHDLLIDVWPRVRERVPDAQLVIAGDGDDRERLQQRVADAGLGCAIRFTGAIDDPTLAAYYRDAAVFVLSSRYEGMPLALLEAQAMGVPAVAFDCPTGPADIITPDTGILVPRGDVDALAAALVALLGDPARRERMAHAALKRSREVFSPETHRDRWMALVRRVAASQVPAGEGRRA